MKTVVLLVCSLYLIVEGSILFPNPDQEFTNFKIKFNKTYRSWAEEETRFAAFKKNLDRIEKHNGEKHSWKMGITQFADLTRDEFVQTHLQGYKPFGTKRPTMAKKENINIDLPESVDWREKGIITEVRDQGMCGSCWAFAAASQIASYAKLNDMSHPLEEISVQHLVSCSGNPLQCGGTGGCMGSIAQLAFTYTSLFGVVKEEDYPYTSDVPWGDDGETCKYDATTTPATAVVMGFETLPHNDLDSVMYHLANVGPLATTVAASDGGLYFEGVFDGCDYNENIEVNHQVQLVGY
ncbi:cysteine protease RD19A isoform X2 [Eurytemora carolleeae]|nr:cysteine protease RD19A isoform X2 [Eurytemora carolleeae]|eukprot:XP_023347981.1 cysteine protease RD19A-like isoform X2 [Eurytemora affinis]